MKKIAGLWVLLAASAWAAGVGSTAPCTISIAQEGPADDIFVDTSGSQPAIYLSLNGVARQVDPALTEADIARLKRERELCATSGGTQSLKIRLPQVTSRPLSRWVVADFSGDGRNDSVYASANGLSVQLGVAGTGFANPVRTTLGSASDNYTAAAAGDLNGDGKLDLVVCCSGSGADSTSRVLLGNGNGTFAAPIAGVPAISFALVDWNRDGKLDLISLTGSGTITFSAGQGNGTFSLVRSTTVPTGQTIVVVDATGDGLDDVLVLAPRQLLMLPGAAGGLFGNYLTTDLFWNQAITMTAGDFTGDGKLDLAVTHQFGLTELLTGDPPVRFVRTGLMANPQFVRAAAVDLDDVGGAELLMPGTGSNGLLIVPVNSAGVPQANALYGITAGLNDYPGYDPQRTAVAVGDLDRDGADDVVLASPLTAQMVIQVFSAKGPQPPITINGTSSNRFALLQMQVADVTGDGWPDLVALEGDSQSLLMYRNLGDGKLAAPVATALDTPPRSFVMADFNGDGRLDIAIGMGPTPKIQVRYNTGAGVFGSFQNLTVSAIPYRLAAGDLNNDFRPDLIFLPVAAAGNLPAVVIPNRIDNQFQAPITLPLKPYGSVGISGSLGAVATGDFNLDGFGDVIVAAPFTSGEVVMVFAGDGKGGFRAQANDPVFAANVSDLLVTDVDADGKLDLLAAHCCGDAMTRLYYGKGDGTFSLPHPKPMGGWADRVLLGDVNGDGRPELIARTYSGAAVAPFNAATTVRVANAANGRGPTVAIDSIVSAYGEKLAPQIASALTVDQLELIGTRVTITDSAGKVANAPISYASPTQVNFSIPGGLAEGPARITLLAAGNVSRFADITLARVSPGLFLVGPLVAANVIRVKANGQQVAELPFAVDSLGLRAVPIDLGPVGENIVLVLYATGVRGRNSLSNVRVTIGGVDAQVFYAGAQNEYPGFDQLNVALPRSLAGRGSVEVIVTVEGQAANAGRIEVK